MLVAKLKKPVEKIYQKSGLQTEVVTADYLIANVNNYVIGQSNTFFYYKIGKVEFNQNGQIKEFNPVIRGGIDLTAEDLQDWGTDDFVALKAISKKLGIEIEDTPIIYKEGLFKA